MKKLGRIGQKICRTDASLRILWKFILSQSSNNQIVRAYHFRKIARGVKKGMENK